MKTKNRYLVSGILVGVMLGFYLGVYVAVRWDLASSCPPLALPLVFLVQCVLMIVASALRSGGEESERPAAGDFPKVSSGK